MRQDEQESQIVAPDFDGDQDHHFSSPTPHNRLAETGGAGSFVEETQYGCLVKDSQATETQPFEVNRSFAVNHDTSFANPLVSATFFSNPTEKIEPQNLQQGFKFGTNKKPVAGQYNRPARRTPPDNSTTDPLPPAADKINVPSNVESLNVALSSPQVLYPQLREPHQLARHNVPTSFDNIDPTLDAIKFPQHKGNNPSATIKSVDPGSHKPRPQQFEGNNLLATVNNTDPASHISKGSQPKVRDTPQVDIDVMVTSVRKGSSGSYQKPASMSTHPMEIIPDHPKPMEQFKTFPRQRELPPLQNISVESEPREDKLRPAGAEQIHHRQSTSAQIPAHSLKPPTTLSELTADSSSRRTKRKGARPVVAFPNVATLSFPDTLTTPRRYRQQKDAENVPRSNPRDERGENVLFPVAQSNTGRVRTPDNNRGFGRGDVGSDNLGLDQAFSVARKDQRPPMRYNDRGAPPIQMRYQSIGVNEKDPESHPPMVRLTGQVTRKQIHTTPESHNKPNFQLVQNLPHDRESNANADESDQGYHNLNASKPPNLQVNNDLNHDGLRVFAQITQDPIQQGHLEVIVGGDLLLDEATTAESINHGLSDPPAIPEASSRQASPSRTTSHPRPASRRSNLSRTLTPPSPRRTRHAEAEDVLRNRSGLTNKVKNSHNVQSASTKSQKTNGVAQLQGTSDLLVGYEKFLASGKQYAEVLQDYEFQKQRVEAQRREIDELRKANEGSKEQIAKLKTDKAKLDEKIKKLTDHCSKYKNHMNDVVKSQKFLRIQAAEMKAKSKEILHIRIEAQKKDSEAHARGEAMLQKIDAALKQAREFRAAAEIRNGEKVKKLEEQLTLENEHHALKNKKLGKDLDISETEKKALTTENIRLTAENEKLERSKKRLEKERKELQDEKFESLEKQENLKRTIISANLLNNSLQASIDSHLVELSHEKYSSELLQKTVEGQLTAHKDLLEAIEQAPVAVARELCRGGGVLATITASVNTTRANINEANNLLNSLTAASSETPPAIVKLIENLSSRIDNAREAAEQTRSSLQKSTSKLVEDLKASIDQLRVNRETENRLNARVQGLGQMNESLSSEKKTLEDGAQDLRNEIEKLHQEVSSYDVQLKNKNTELAAALVVPKEDPKTKIKLQQLESINNGLESQLEIASQHITKLKEDVRKIQETLDCKEQQIKDLESKYDDAQITIKSFDEARARYDTEKEQEKQIAIEDAIRTAGADQAAVTSRLEAEVQKLDQLRKEGEAELITAREELQQLREANESLDSTAKDCQTQVDAFKDSFARQIAVLNNLQARTPGRQTTDKLHGDLESLRIDIGNVKGNFKVTKGINHQNHQNLLDQQLQMEEKLLAIDVLEKQRDSAEHEVSLLKAQNESQKEELARQALIQKEKESAEREVSILKAQIQSQELARRALLEKQKESAEREVAPLKAQSERQKEELARQAAQNTGNNQVQRVVTPVQQIINDDNVLRHSVISETPGNALRQAIKQATASSDARGSLRGDHLDRVGGSVEKDPIHIFSTTATTAATLQSSTPRSLRVAARKGSSLAYSQILENVNHRGDSSQTSKLKSQTFPTGNGRAETNQHLQTSREIITVPSPQETGVEDVESSPLTTDTDEFQIRMDDIDHRLAQSSKKSIQNSRVQGRKGEGISRKRLDQQEAGSTSTSTVTVSTTYHQTTSRSSISSLKRNRIPPEYDCSNEEPTPKKTKFSDADVILPSGMLTGENMSAASKAEVSRKRREYKPLKSVLKNSAEAPVNPNNLKIDVTQKPANNSLLSTSGRLKGTVQISAPHRGPSMYKGVVQGRNLRPSASSSSAYVNNSGSIGATTADRHNTASVASTKQTYQLSGQRLSTITGAGRRASRIRVAAPRPPLKTVIPDPQESYYPPKE